MLDVIYIFAALTLLIALNALFVAAEFSAVASRRTRIGQMAGSGNRLARILFAILDSGEALDRYVAACQVGITISSLVLGAFGQSTIAVAIRPGLTSLLTALSDLLNNAGISVTFVAAAVAESIATIGVLVFITVLQVIVGELLPKSIAVQYPERVALGVVTPVRWSMALMRPIIWFFNGSGRLLLRLLRVSPEHTHAHSPEEIEILVSESHEGGLLDRSERQMLRNAFRLRELTARQVMVHRTRMVTAPVDSTVAELMEISARARYTRIPLYEDSIDTIKGFVHMKDVFGLYVRQSGQPVDILRPVVYVPESLSAVDVWETLQTSRQYMAVVFDEYGGTAGLITLEDLIEEIVGELQDEFDDEQAVISFDETGERTFLRGDLLVADVNEYFDFLDLPLDVADTLSGLIFSTLGREPNVGDEVTINNCILRVEAMADPGVKTVSIAAPSSQVPLISEWEVSDRE